METENRLGITPEFIAAVKEGLRKAKSKDDPLTVAKLLWTNDRLEYRVPYGKYVTSNQNAHKDGKAVGGVANTVARMYSK